MTIAALVRLPNGYFTPSDEEDERKLRHIKRGDVLLSEFRRARNGAHHRKLFALLRIMFESQDRFRNFDDMLVDIKIRCGHYREYITADGEIVYVPKSIAYNELDQAEFDSFYDKVVEIALDRDSPYLRGLPPHELEAELERRLHFG